jgi:hypothetical protein
MHLISILIAATLAAGEEPHSSWPRDYTVARDDAAGRLVISTPYYEVVHDLKSGGAISAVRYRHGRAENLLVRPIGAEVEDGAGTTFSDLHDVSPRVSHERVAREHGPTEVVSVESALLDGKGRASGVRLRTAYEYRWGFIKVRRQFLFPADPWPAKAVCPLATVLAPSLTDNGYRDGTTEVEGAPPFSFGSCRWGKLRPGSSDPPIDLKLVPRYMVLADPGVEGIEWFAGSDLSQWESGPAGRRGQGRCRLEASRDPAGLALSIRPLSLESGAVPLTGSLAFDSSIGLSILDGRAQSPWLHTSFNRNRGDWVSAEQIKGWAASGISTVHCHNDGDYYGDGLFWRDGSYPPYPDMARYDAVIAGCRAAGIRTATYFSNKELHSSTKEFQEHGQEWGRKDSKGNIQRNFYKAGSEFGVQMCLRSGWLKALEASIDRVLTNHRLDGVYYDWNVALLCCNPIHNGARPGQPVPAVAAAPHWDMDELLDLMEWTRRRVGPKGLVIVHNTTTPMLATENFADHVVAMEWGYGKKAEDAAPLVGLPLEWSFAGARSRGVISYGAIEGGAAARLHRLFALESLMSGVTPWPAGPQTFELYPVLKPIGDFATCRFADWRQTAVTVTGNRCAAAIYSRPGESFILLANLDKAAQAVRCAVHAGKLPHPLAGIKSAEIAGGSPADGGAPAALDAARLSGEGVEIPIPADGVRLLRVR